MKSLATHLECSRGGEDFQLDTLQQTCTNDGGPLLVRYDIEKGVLLYPAEGTVRRHVG